MDLQNNSDSPKNPSTVTIENDQTNITSEEDGDVTSTDGNTRTNVSTSNTAHVTPAYETGTDEDQQNRNLMPEKRECELTSEKFDRENLEKAEIIVQLKSSISGSEDDNENVEDVVLGSNHDNTDDIGLSQLNDSSHKLLHNVDLDQITSDENDQGRNSLETTTSNNGKIDSVDHEMSSEVVDILQSPNIETIVKEESPDRTGALVSPESSPQGKMDASPVMLVNSPSLESIISESSEETKQNRMNNLSVTSDDDSLEKVTPLEDSKWQFTECANGDGITSNGNTEHEIKEEITLKQLIDNSDEVDQESDGMKEEINLRQLIDNYDEMSLENEEIKEEITLEQLISNYDESNQEMKEDGDFTSNQLEDNSDEKNQEGEKQPGDILVNIINENQRDQSTSVMSNLTDCIDEFHSTDNDESNPSVGIQSSGKLSSKYPDYPENYNDYKVCRNVAPGIKECLILETGETNCCRELSADTTNQSSTNADNFQSSQLSPNHSPSSNNQISSPSSSQSKFKIKKPLYAQLEVHRDLVLDSDKEEITASQAEEHENELNVPINSGSVTKSQSDNDVRLESSIQITYLQEKNRDRLGDDGFDNIRDNKMKNILRRNPADSSSDSDPLYHSHNQHSYTQPEYYPIHTSLYSHTSASDVHHSTEYPDVARQMNYGNSKYAGGVYVTQPYGMPSITSLTETNQERETRKFSPRAAVSSPSSGPVPGYKSLQEQQTSWLQMFRDLEEQHNKELKWQYKQHRLTIDRIQDQLEHDLSHQQNLFSSRLDRHKETLENTKNLYSHLGHGDFPLHLKSYGSINYDHSEGYAEDEMTDADDHDRLRKLHKRSPRAARSMTNDTPTFQADYLPSTRNILKSASDVPSTALPVKRSLEHEFSSPYSSPEPESRTYRHRISLKDEHNSSELLHNETGAELPRAGVYSSPMPNVAYRDLTKFSDISSIPPHMFNSQTEVSTPQRSEIKRNMEFRDEHICNQSPLSRNLHSSSLFDDISLSPNTRLNLREKHSKHLADLRAYYEEEIQDLRTALNSSDQSRMQADHIFLQTDNKKLKKKSIDLENQLDDALIQIRELQQKLMGLESRSGDYACMYKESQGMVVVLEKRINELEEYCQEKDVRIRELESRAKQHMLALQETKKMLENQEENSRRDQATMKRLVDKYEGLEKEYKLLQNTATATEAKLFDTRNEIIEVNRTISKVEMENKRLNRENDCLRARIKQSAGLSFSNGYHSEYGSSGANHQDRQNFDPRFFPREEVDGASEEFLDGNEYSTSPILMAERELIKIRQKMQHQQVQVEPPIPKLQKKFYGSDVSIHSKSSNTLQNNSTVNSIQNTPTKSRLRDKNVKNSPTLRRKSKSPKPKAVQKMRDKSKSPLSSPKKSVSVTAESSSPMRFDVPWDNIPNNEKNVTRAGQISCPVSIQNHHDPLSNKTLQGRGKVGVNVQSMLDKIKAGEYIPRPEWEDVYTSMAKPKKPVVNSLHKQQETKIQDRLKNINDLEKHYDDLQAEKRNLESMLTKIPVTGRVDRKKKRDKEELEEKLDQVQRELGSVRMSLKRFNVLKTSC